MKDDILDAAKTVFLRDGYGASISKIIEEAGIARQSLYNHFKNKRALFDAVVQYVTWETMRPLLTLQMPSDLLLPDALLRFGESYMAGALHPDNLALTRLIGAAVVENPAIGESAFQTRRAIPMLAGYLAAQHGAGLIDCPRADIVADGFAGALVGPARYRYLINIEWQMSDKERRDHLREVVCIFVAGMNHRSIPPMR